jgi:SAM-dependent methyltransferase
MTAIDASTTRSYDRLASAYACLSAGYDHERWLAKLIGVANGAGLRGTRALDVGCGTGATTEPLVDAGFEVTGIDLSPGMLELARGRLEGRARLIEADMRALPRLGAFDLVVCVDDALNHLLTRADLEAALQSMARNLAPHGVLVFDLNTLATMRRAFSEDSSSADGSAVVLWRGLGDPELPPGGITRAELTVFELGAGRSEEVERLAIVERHHPLDEVLQLLWTCGLEPAAVLGQHRGARLDGEPPDERVHHKIVVAARRPVGISTWACAHSAQGGVC